MGEKKNFNRNKMDLLFTLNVIQNNSQIITF